MSEVLLEGCPWDCDDRPGGHCALCEGVGWVYLWWHGSTERNGGHWTSAPICLCGELHHGRWSAGRLSGWTPQ